MITRQNANNASYVTIRTTPFLREWLTAYRWRDSACVYLITVPRLIQSVMQIDGV